MCCCFCIFGYVTSSDFWYDFSSRASAPIDDGKFRHLDLSVAHSPSLRIAAEALEWPQKIMQWSKHVKKTLMLALQETEPMAHMPVSMMKTWWYRAHPDLLIDWYKPVPGLMRSLAMVSGTKVRQVQGTGIYDHKQRFEDALCWYVPDAQERFRGRALCGVCGVSCFDDEDNFRHYFRCEECKGDYCVLCIEKVWAYGRSKWLCDQCNPVQL